LKNNRNMREAPATLSDVSPPDFWPASTPTAQAHALGHRDRLRQRVKAGGFEPLPDYELLELILFRTFPRGDVKPLAKTLLKRFGSLAGVFGASVAELCTVKGVGEAAALDIGAVQQAALRIAREPAVKRTVISSWSALLAYVRVALANEPREQFRVLFLDKKNQLIADEVMNRGTVDHAPVYPREVMRRALEVSAAAVILVHNHPSGDPTPSSADFEMTRQVAEAGKALRISVHDHLIVGREGVASLKALGLF
jgi:DNA repair protein RadC